MLYLALPVLFVLVAAYKLCKLLAVPRALEHVPTISLSGSVASMLSSEPFDRSFERLARPVLKKSGVAKLWVFGQWELVFGEAQQAKEILLESELFTKSREGENSTDVLLGVKALGKSNISNADGEEWRRHRRVANPAFKKTWSTAMFGGCTTNLIRLIKEAEGAPLQIHGLFQRLTLDVLGKGLFSYDFDAIAKGEENHYLRLYNKVMKAIFNPTYIVFPFLENWVPWRRTSQRQVQEFRDFLRDIIHRRKAELTATHDDLLSLMIKASVDEVGFTDENVIDDLFLFFFAGHDTTANTLTTAFYHLSKHQDLQERAREEVMAVLEGETRIPTAQELKEMPYIECIIKESMRIGSTAPILRRYCKDGYTLSNGFSIPKDSYVNIHLWNIHYDEKIYPDPHVYNPSRFKNDHGPQDNQWMAFGYGSRMCIGKNFSLIEQRVVLAMTLQHFTLTLGPAISQQGKPAISSNGMLHPIGVDVIFTPRL